MTEEIVLPAPVEPDVLIAGSPEAPNPEDNAVDDAAELKKCVETITRCKLKEEENFRELVGAIHQLHARKLCPPGFESPTAFLMKKFGYSRSYCLRLASEGKLLKRLSTRVDTLPLLKSDAHLRLLVALPEEDQDRVLELVKSWAVVAGLNDWSPKLIESAITFLRPPTAPPDRRESVEVKLVRKFKGLVDEAKAGLPEKTEKLILEKFDVLGEKALALGRARRTTGIDWTEATWNPLQGCTRASAGCDNCYAAKLMATRRAGAFPGLARAIVKNGKKSYAFMGKIVLLPDHLSDALSDRAPKRYFVNSMSDLFHPLVPVVFIDAVFSVMEKATWHEFQVLTKRPDRMAEYTSKRYEKAAPPENVWLGTTTEDQETFDERYADLLKTKAAVRWLSVEPLIGPIEFASLKDVDWVVVGGETGSDRRMEKGWVESIRDQCAAAKVAFYFKQWGDFGEDGMKSKRKPKKDGLVPAATLDGKIYNAYPR